MTISRQERSRKLDEILVSLNGLRGVTTAAVVDQDGFVTHIRRDFDVDADALGAAVQIMHTAAHRAAEQVSQGSTKLLLSENQHGMVLLAPLSRGFVLALVADESAMLGAVRFEVRETIPSLNELFGG